MGGGDEERRRGGGEEERRELGCKKMSKVRSEGGSVCHQSRQNTLMQQLNKAGQRIQRELFHMRRKKIENQQRAASKSKTAPQSKVPASSPSRHQKKVSEMEERSRSMIRGCPAPQADPGHPGPPPGMVGASCPQCTWHCSCSLANCTLVAHISIGLG